MTDRTKCDECNGTGYWSNYPPKPDEPLDMQDCCGVCCGKGYLTPEEEDAIRCEPCVGPGGVRGALGETLKGGKP